MFKKAVSFCIAFLSVSVLFASCGKEQISETQKAVLINDREVPSTAQPVEKRTETKTFVNTPKETETATLINSPKETEFTPTELCSVPLINSYFPTPIYQYFYNNSMKEKDTYLSSEVAEILNNSLKNNRWGMLKLYADNKLIQEITSSSTCLEVVFDKPYLLDVSADIEGAYPQKYDKILIVLDGEYKDTVFFSLDDEYKSGPIKDIDGKISEKLLAHIYDAE